MLRRRVVGRPAIGKPKAQKVSTVPKPKKDSEHPQPKKGN